MATDFSDIRAEVAEANRELANAGLVSLSFGNASQADRENGCPFSGDRHNDSDVSAIGA